MGPIFRVKKPLLWFLACFCKGSATNRKPSPLTLYAAKAVATVAPQQNHTEPIDQLQSTTGKDLKEAKLINMGSSKRSSPQRSAHTQLWQHLITRLRPHFHSLFTHNRGKQEIEHLKPFNCLSLSFTVPVWGGGCWRQLITFPIDKYLLQLENHKLKHRRKISIKMAKEHTEHE